MALAPHSASCHGLLVCTSSGVEVWSAWAAALSDTQTGSICRALALATANTADGASKQGLMVLNQPRVAVAYAFEDGLVVAAICEPGTDRLTAHAKAHELLYAADLLFGAQIRHATRDMPTAKTTLSQQQLKLAMEGLMGLLYAPPGTNREGNVGRMHSQSGMDGLSHAADASIMASISHAKIAGYMLTKLQAPAPAQGAFAQLAGLPHRTSSHQVDLDASALLTVSYASAGHAPTCHP